MANEKYTMEELLSKLLVVQSKLEYEANALDALIKTAYRYAENKDEELRYLFDAFKAKAEAIKNAVQTIEH